MFLPYCAFLVVRSNYWSHDSLSYLTCTRFQSQVSCLPKKRGFFRFASAFSNCFDKTPSFSFFAFSLSSLCERTKVHFAQNPAPILQAYVDSGEGLDRAGGFAIQVSFLKPSLSFIIDLSFSFPLEMFLKILWKKSLSNWNLLRPTSFFFPGQRSSSHQIDRGRFQQCSWIPSVFFLRFLTWVGRDWTIRRRMIG